jgi:basic membrane protein A
MIECVQKGEAIAVDWCGGIEEGSVVLTDINDKAAAAGTADAIKTATEGLKNGTVNVFDTANFTVGGAKLESHKVEDKEVIENGIFKESKIMAAPYFDLRIDGITLLNEKY